MQCSYTFHNGIKCDQPVEEGHKTCIFHRRGISGSQIDELRDKIRRKIEFKDYNFEGYNFPEMDFFSGYSFEDEANFIDALFFGYVTFRNSNFMKKAYFQKARFMEDADFTNVIFHAQADFTGSVLTKENIKISFYNATFSDRVDFNNAIFFGRADFSHVRFTEAYFRYSTFSFADFSHTSFSKADFIEAQFQEVFFWRTNILDGLFNNARILGVANFENAKLSNIKFINTSFRDNANFDYTHDLKEDGITRTHWKGDFTSAIFEKTATFKDAYLDPCFESTNMPQSNLRDIRWRQGKRLFGIDKKRLLDEREADKSEYGIQKMRRYRKAVRTYFFLRNQLHSEGDFVDESDFFFRERLTQMKLLGTRIHLDCARARLTAEEKEEVISLCDGLDREYILEWLWLYFTFFTCGFGERILYIVNAFGLTWFISAIIIILNIDERPTLCWQNLIRALYMSTGALSNMGYAEEIALPLTPFGHWVVQIEALAGILLISLFLIVFVRKMSRQ